jgi:DNA segregation ATPase FtsK/SpoIIIE, S-DNA-T family
VSENSLALVLANEHEPEKEIVLGVPKGATVRAVAKALAAYQGASQASPVVLRSQRHGVLPSDASFIALGLRVGDRIALGARHDDPSTAPMLAASGTELRIVAGPDAGGTIQTSPRGPVSVGRTNSSACIVHDPALSRSHFSLSDSTGGVLVTDLASRSGVSVRGNKLSASGELVVHGDFIEAGHSLFRCLRPTPFTEAALGDEKGNVTVSRPPKPASIESPKLYQSPDPQTGTSSQRKAAFARVLGPTVVGVPMLVASAATGRIVYLFAGIFSLVIGLALRLVTAKDTLKSNRSGLTSGLATLADLEKRMAEDRGLAEQRRWAAQPDPFALLRMCELATNDLWSRRPTDQDFLSVALGWGDQPGPHKFDPGNRNAVLPPKELADLLTLRAVPIVINLRTYQTVALIGRAEATESILRHLVLQLVSLHSPSNLSIVAALPDQHDQNTEETTAKYLRWLPHVGPIETGTGLRFGESQSNLLAKDLGDRLDSQPGKDQQNHTVAVIFEASGINRSAVVDLIARGKGKALSILWIGERNDRVPGGADLVIQVSAENASFQATTIATGDIVGPHPFTGISYVRMLDAARNLSGVVDDELGHASSIPQSVSLYGLAPAQNAFNAKGIEKTWQSATFSARAPIGIGTNGAFWFDLDSDGPHALVGGTTGAGKSELLQTLVTSFAARYSPEATTFLLVDYKGGAAFRDVQNLPHVVGLVTDLDEALVERVLISLSAELRRREQWLKERACKDLAELARRIPDQSLPRLLIVIDEFAALKRELPDFVDGIVDIAQRGRSLGVHLILATQRPAGVISDNIRANTNLRIALRMNDAADSRDVLGTPAAASLSRSVPGRAFVRIGQAEMAEVQIAYGGEAVPGVETSEVVRVRAFGGPVQSDAARSGAEVVSQQDAVVAMIGDAFANGGYQVPERPFREPLPTLFSREVLKGTPPFRANVPSGCLAYAVVDIPEMQSQEAKLWNTASGNLVAIGVAGSGKTTFLETVLRQTRMTPGLETASLLVLDGGGGKLLRSTEDLAAKTAVISDGENLELLISELADTFEQRRSAPDPETLRVPIIVAIDDAGELRRALEEQRKSALLDRLYRVINGGVPVGIAFIVTSSSRTALPMGAMAGFSERLIMRQNSADELSLLGMPRQQAALKFPPGRCLDINGHQVQIATSQG